MQKRTLVGFMIAMAFVLASCDSDETKKPGYQAGYAAGHEDGQAEKKSEMCSQIETFSDSIHTALENEGICG